MIPQNAGLSSSTSRLHVKPPVHNSCSPEPLTKRYSSTEGRFSIIDECSKDDTSSSDSDFDMPISRVPQRSASTKTPRIVVHHEKLTNFSKSVDLSGSHSTSRFRIVPLESRYKRGRWQCYDSYEPEPTTKRTNSSNAIHPLRPVSDRPVRTWTYIESPNAAPIAKTAEANFAFSSSNGRDSNQESSQNEINPLQTGLESTLNTSDIKDIKAIPKSPSIDCATPLAAIDSKIEQAMDLVKTHLMLAVREEVENLRAKIVDLEMHVQMLESENAVLREHSKNVSKTTPKSKSEK